MKIAIDVSQVVHPGGVGVYTRNLVNNLLKIDKENEYLLFGASLRKYQLLQQPFLGEFTAKFYPLSPTLIEFMFNQLRFPPIDFFTGKIDLFHSSDWTEPKANCLKVTTVHDLAPIIYPEMHDIKIVEVFKRKLKLVKKESKILIAVSSSTKDDLVNKIGISEEKIKVIYEAVDENFAKTKADESILKKFNLKSFIISDALKNERKNLGNLLNAFENLQDKNLQLILPGESLWGEEKIKTIIEKSSLKDKIIMTGMLTLGELKALYKNAVVAVFPSFYEGFGLAILEAMSCGCPVITSNISSLPEVAGDAAILVDPRDTQDIAEAIKKVAYNRSIYYQLKNKGLQQVQKFSWQKTAQETLEVYKEVGKQC